MKLKSKNLSKIKYKYLTFIPARSGSKELKHKNLQKINGKTLLEHTINFIKKINLKKNFIFVSTDSNKYSTLSKKLGVHSSFLRSKKNSSSTSLIDDAIFELLNHKNFLNYDFEILILLLPTQPFRDPYNFKEGIQLISKKRIKSVISVKNLNRNTNYIFRMRSQRLLIKKNLKATNRQFIDSNYTPCGCFYLTKINSFKKYKSIFNVNNRGIITQYPQNLDIDNKQDLYIARIIMENKKKFNLNI